MKSSNNVAKLNIVRNTGLCPHFRNRKDISVTSMGEFKEHVSFINFEQSVLNCVTIVAEVEVLSPNFKHPAVHERLPRLMSQRGHS